MSDPEKTKPERNSIRISRVVTRTGDDGTTGLVGGQRVSKADPRLEAYGSGDELQAAMGVARDAVSAALGRAGAAAEYLNNMNAHLLYVQNLLFTFNGELATRVEDRWPGMPLITAETITYLEELITTSNAPLPPLKDFILPGGHTIVSALHVCRVIARRVERNLEALAQHEAVGDFTRPFVNRLSDLFFVMARRTGHELKAAGVEYGEPIWQRDLPAPEMP